MSDNFKIVTFYYQDFIVFSSRQYSKSIYYVDENMYIQGLKIGYWNIHGIQSTDKSLKTGDKKVQQLILSHDIFAVSEVHCGENTIPEISDYGCFKLCHGLNTKVNRHFGGIVVYYKRELRNGIKFLENNFADFVWIKLCKEFFGLENDMFVCMAYIPPDNSTYYKARNIDSIEILEKEILNKSALGEIVILGDLNARTGTLPDFIVNDSEFGNFSDELYEVDKINLFRHSLDTIVTTRGRQIIELCKTTRLRILNGRVLGDAVGQYY